MARVLIIDDDLMVNRVLQEHLTNEGYEVSAAYMAEEGFAMALKSPPDLILLDVNMPDATGFQMCGRFREHPSTESIPIIMMTGAARWPNQQAIGKRMGANEYILKPFDVIQVGNQVHTLMGSKRPLQKKISPSEALVEPPAQPEIISEPIEPPWVEPAPVAPVPAPIEPVAVSSEQAPASPLEARRFFDFSVEVLIFVSRMPRTRAGKHLADQLLRTGTSVGARIQESQAAESTENGIQALRAALKDLREAGYWLMLMNKSGLVETPSLKDLETKCQELIFILTTLIVAPKQNAGIENL